MTTIAAVGRVTPPSFRVNERIVEFVCGGEEGMNRVGSWAEEKTKYFTCRARRLPRISEFKY